MSIHFSANFIRNTILMPSDKTNDELSARIRALQNNKITESIFSTAPDNLQIIFQKNDQEMRNEVLAHITGRLSPELAEYEKPKVLFQLSPGALFNENDFNKCLILMNQWVIDIAKQMRSSLNNRGGQGVGFDKVAGMKELKDLLRDEVIGPYQNPGEYQDYGIEPPKGILLYGPPGCGKTFIAEALAEEMSRILGKEVPFISHDKEKLESKMHHETARLIGEMFDKAMKTIPSIVYLDELDGIMPNRNDERLQASEKEELRQLLIKIQEAEKKGVIVIAATNRPEQIDWAVMRTGRMDKLIYVPAPDLEARKEALKFHMKRRRNKEGVVDYDLLAEKTKYFSQTDLETLVNQAAFISYNNKQLITTESFLKALTAGRVKPSLTPEKEQLFKTIESRGMDNVVTERKKAPDFIS